LDNGYPVNPIQLIQYKLSYVVQQESEFIDHVMRVSDGMTDKTMAEDLLHNRA